MAAIHNTINAGSGDSAWAVVLMYGGEEITRACIESLLAQDHSALNVLLVDNASPDGSGARLRDAFPRIHYLNTGSNLGYAGGNNRGATYAMDHGADFVLILNNDTVVSPDCVSRLVRSARGAERVGAVAPKILYFEDPRRVWYAGGDYSVTKALGLHRGELELDDPNEAPRLDEVTFVSGCCMLVPSAVFREMGGFREDFFMYCEDVELSLRLSRAGYRLYYQPAARLLHRDKLDRRAPSPNAIMYRDRNRRRLVRQHYGVRDRLKFALWFYPTRVIRFVEYVATGSWREARAVVAGAVAA